MSDASFRDLTREEYLLLRRILEIESDQSKLYLAQLEGIRARPSCTCGCPSISLAVSAGCSKVVDASDRIVADLCGQTAEGLSVGVLLFQDDGKLSELEIYPYEDAGSFSLPTLESLGR